MNSNTSTQQGWVLLLSIIFILVDATIFILRSALFGAALVIVNVALFTYWLYGVVISRRPDRQVSEYDIISSKSGVQVKDG